MGGVFRVGVSVSVEDLHGEGLVHCHVRARDLPPQQLHRLPVSAGENKNKTKTVGLALCGLVDAYPAAWRARRAVVGACTLFV